MTDIQSPPLLLAAGQWAPASHLFLAAVLIPTLYLTANFAFSCLSGWRELASHFHAKRQPGGDAIRFVSISLAAGVIPTSYRNCIKLQIFSDGILMSAFSPLVLFHPPLFIPKEAIQECRRETYFFMPVTVLYFHKGMGRMRLFGFAGQAILDWCQRKGVPTTA